ncbi:caspase-like protein, partial [Asbolus verrucosus]
KSGKHVPEFVERKDLLVSSFEYSRNGNNPGLVLIFNQESFEDINMSYRFGSRRDVNEIIICMSRLGFNISEERNIFTDLKRKDILQVVDDITKEDLSDACKGSNSSTIVSEQGNQQIDLVPNNTFETNFIGPDMLIVYSTTEGNYSFRDAKTGTWFIQELCKNFSTYGRRDDVISLVTRTTKCLCRNYYHHDDDKIHKQMPIFISTLNKKFYLNRSKERNILVKVLKDQKDMCNKIKELEVKVEELMQEKEKKSK